MNIVAIIPARGGSKRIPKKNIRFFAGQPIISYSIRAAQEAQLFDHIIVSTDSDEIVKIAKSYGAEVPFMRPAELADDLTHVDAVVLHALKWLIYHGQQVNYVCCILPTSPLMLSKYIQKGLELLKENEATSAFPVTTFPSTIFRALRINDNKRVEMIWPEYFNSHSQDLPLAYREAGQFYWADAEKYLKEKSFYSKDAIPIVLPSYLVQDIDTEEDWINAEMKYKMWMK